MDHEESELTPLARRMIAASSLGIYIQNESGHSYITIDIREVCHRFPQMLHHEEFRVLNVEVAADEEPLFIIKEYGSFAACLNRIDKFIAPETLLKVFDDLNYYDNYSNIIGTEPVE